jgi:putative glycosyltransferase (TIGR04372 family)
MKFQVMTTNHQFFGHLLLEPEKYLSARDAKKEIFEIDFIGEKDWRNIGVSCHGATNQNVFTLWTLGRLKRAPNSQLIRMWKRSVHRVPGFVAGMMIRASRSGKLENVSEYRFSSLLSIDKDLDATSAHLRFSKKELGRARGEAKELGMNPDIPHVCLIVRNETTSSTDSELRSRSIHDFELAAHEIVSDGLQLVRMGASASPLLRSDSPKLFDYANSGRRSELLDLYLLSSCAFAVSTLSGPDAACLAFRRPVLYVDLANYALCFSGTLLTTWSPAKIVSCSTGSQLSLEEVFSSGAGWFWKDSQFLGANLRIERSNEKEIAGYVREMLARYHSETLLDAPTNPQQLLYQNRFASAMGELGEEWHGPIRSHLAESFLEANGKWFLS